jgi:hypothetical protein
MDHLGTQQTRKRSGLATGRKQDETPHVYGSANLHPNASFARHCSAANLTRTAADTAPSFAP